MGATITTRVSDEIAQELNFFTRVEHEDTSTLVRKLLATALEEKRLAYALEKYKAGNITLGKAAEIAHTSLREMLLIASKEGIPFQYSLKNLEEDLKAL